TSSDGSTRLMVTRQGPFAPAIASARARADRVSYVEAGDEKSALACSVATIMGVTIVSVKAQTARDTGAGRVANHPARKEASGASDEGARGRAERAVKEPFPSAHRRRCQ